MFLLFLSAFFASLFFLSQVANAEIKMGSVTATPGIMYQTNYVGEFTGVTTNRTKPSYGVDLNLSHDSGLYLYNAYKERKNYPDSSSVSAYGTFDFELCSVLGFAKSAASLNLDVSYENCHVDSKTEKNTGTYYFRVNTDVKKELNIGAAYALDTTDGSVSGSRKLLKDAYKFFGTYDFGVLKAFANYMRTEMNGNYNSASITALKRTGTEFGINVPYQQFVFKAKAGFGQSNLTVNQGSNLANAGGSYYNFRGYQGQVEYNLSKRTNLYGIYGRVSGDLSATTNFTMNAVAGGIKHVF